MFNSDSLFRWLYLVNQYFLHTELYKLDGETKETL